MSGENPVIEPRDVIRVAKAGTVYVVGAVDKPGEFPIKDQENMTVLRAVSLAAGPNRHSAPQKARIIRETGGKKQEIAAPINDILRGRRPDVDDQKRDVGCSVVRVRRDDDGRYVAVLGDPLNRRIDAFTPIVELIRQAAADPQVVAIKQTLYRTSSNSPIVDALAAAALAGKEVTVIIELLARFDEKANISLATRLQEAGAQVVYGIVGYKTHAKMLLILRRENQKLRYYTHLGTGNYHPNTARLYTDYALLTADPEIGEDVRRVFVQLTSLGKLNKLHKLLPAPFVLHRALLEKIEREAQHARDGRPARIVFKINALVETQLIQALYRASRAGVKISLIVRGVCCLRPGIPNVSENIEVRSIIGRFLEHSRIALFENGGNPEILASSADLMDRNMFRRVEVCFPIENKKLQERIRRDLDYYLCDNTQAWILQGDGGYARLTPRDGEEPAMAQQRLLEETKK